MVKLRCDSEPVWEYVEEWGWKVIRSPEIDRMMHLPKRGWYEVEIEEIDGTIYGVFRKHNGQVHSVKLTKRGGQVCTCYSYQTGRYQQGLKVCKHIALIGALFSPKIAQKVKERYSESQQERPA